MKRIVIGTAGHIDHGKTALIKALTGIDCDRLKVEKERGITTELGFAYFKGKDDILLGIVDVPGHEKFVRHMVSGAWGIDIVLIVVAADEGVMPQTREHVDICELLGLKRAIVVINKVDLVDNEMLDLVIEDVKDFLKGRVFENAPIVPVSSVTNKNIELLIEKIMEVAKETPEKPKEGVFRLPIDRVFSVKGYGTVVTGTCISGTVRLGQQVEIYPVSKHARVRSIQAYYEEREEAFAGERVALNLQGVDRDELERGFVIGNPGRLITTSRIDVSFKLLDLPIKPVRTDTTLRFHIATTQKQARLIILEKDEIKPGEELFCQFILEDPIVALPGDRFIVRGSYFPSQTIGGGIILNAITKKYKRKSPELSNFYNVLKNGQAKEKVEFFIKQSGYEGIPISDLEVFCGLKKTEIEDSLEQLKRERKVFVVGTYAVHENFISSYISQFLDFLKDFHEKNPMKVGVSREELRQKLPKIKDQIFLFVLEALVNEGKIEVEKDRIRLSSSRSFAKDFLLLEKKVLEVLLRFGLCAPQIADLIKEVNFEEKQLKDFMERLVYEGKVVKLKGDMYIHPENLETFKNGVVNFLKNRGEASPSEIKSIFSISRKYLIPLLEYLDEIKITVRKGDKRVLRNLSV